MASAKEKRIRERLEQIKAEASDLAMDADERKPWVEAREGANLAEEAAGLGLELLDDKEK
jgi:hypothetical protein